MPPAVGIAETSSDIEKATIRMKKLITGHPIEIAIGPPLFHACEYVVKQLTRAQKDALVVSARRRYR